MKRTRRATTVAAGGGRSARATWYQRGTLYMKDKVSLQQGHRYGAAVHSIQREANKGRRRLLRSRSGRGSVFRGILLNRDFRGITSDDVDQRERKGTSSGRRREARTRTPPVMGPLRDIRPHQARSKCDGLQGTVRREFDALFNGDLTLLSYTSLPQETAY